MAEAITEIKAGIGADPQSVTGHLLLASAYRTTEDFEAAIKELERGPQTQPSFWSSPVRARPTPSCDRPNRRLRPVRGGGGQVRTAERAGPVGIRASVDRPP